MIALNRLPCALLACIALVVTFALVAVAVPASADWTDVDTQQPEARGEPVIYDR